MKTTRCQIVGCVLAATVTNLLAAPAAGDPAPAPKKGAPVAQLQADFRKLEFGMFLHYNMATYTDEEWVTGYRDPSTFNPGGPIDTDQWADAAKAAGMKYAVLTAKHVAGFCLWDSKYLPKSASCARRQQSDTRSSEFGNPREISNEKQTEHKHE